ncbi:hypothetical protein, partial [Accumulibacter sp.]|uniref:hypothetical protein n=1 Tax=Accumulibacter sp. TaxID=2053492 RepID=UPI0032C23079
MCHFVVKQLTKCHFLRATPLRGVKRAKSKNQGWRRGPRTQRKPKNPPSNSGLNLNRTAERRFSALKAKEPPRSTRHVPPTGPTG